jgi:Steigviridae/Suoliviridae L,D-carboxypeptidase/transpeptidase
MTLRLLRNRPQRHVTFGTLFVDGVMECLTLEDEIRERPGVPVSVWKVPGQTAIPAGRYSISLTMSARFGCVLPLLRDVPGFSGIRIHTGNVIDDTDGCILVGRRVSGMKIVESIVAFRKLIATLERAKATGEMIAMEIRNPLK